MRRLVTTFSTVLLFLLLAPSRVARADAITVLLCTAPGTVCPAGSVVPGSVRTYGINNTLGSNQYTILNIFYAAAGDTFSGTFVTADLGAKYIYFWGTGVASSALGAPVYLDVAGSQNYVTVAGPWTFGEALSGACSAFAGGTAAQGYVNGGGLGVLGNYADCTPYLSTNFGIPEVLGARTNLVGAVSFSLANGEVIDLPFGSSFPDPTINFNDPNNPYNFITTTDIPAGLTFVSDTPEPGSLSLFGSGLAAIALLLRRRLTSAQPSGA